MSLSTTQINEKIAQAQRAQAAYMLDAVRKEQQGEVPTYLYLKTRYLSAAIRILTNTNHGLTNEEIEQIVHCMIKCGDIVDFDNSPLVFPPITVIVPIGGGVRITDLLDGPMGTLAPYAGYLLRVNLLGTAWEWISAASVGSVQLANTVFVSKNGNDSTGVIGQLDKPFITLAAARAAAVAATPSSTNRIRIIVFPGTYLEGIVLANYVDWDLGNAVLDLQSGSLGTIDDNNVACNSVVMGRAVIMRSTAGSKGAVVTRNAATVLDLTASALTSSRGETVECTNGVQFINSTLLTNTNGVAEVACYAGTQTLANKRRIGSQSSVPTLKCNGGIQLITGDMVFGAICNGGTQTIKGVSIGGQITCAGGTQYFYGDASSTAGASVVVCTSGTQYFYGNITQGNAASSALCCAETSSSGTQYIKGTLTNLDMSATGRGIKHASNSTSSIYEVELLTYSEIGFEISLGTVVVKNSKIKTAYTNGSALKKSGGTLILNNCTLIGDGTGYSITSPSAQSVKIYGACQANKALDVTFAITQQVNSITIDSLVV